MSAASHTIVSLDQGLENFLWKQPDVKTLVLRAPDSILEDIYIDNSTHRAVTTRFKDFLLEGDTFNVIC